MRWAHLQLVASRIDRDGCICCTRRTDNINAPSWKASQATTPVIGGEEDADASEKAVNRKKKAHGWKKSVNNEEKGRTQNRGIRLERCEKS